MTQYLSAAQDRKSKSLSGRTVFFYVLVFFAIFIVVDVVFLVIAYKNYPGVVTENAYSQGLEFNKKILASKERSKLGISDKLTIEEQKDNSSNMLFEIRLKDQKSLTSDKVKVIAKRPIRAGEDFTFNLVKIQEGQYANNIKFPEQGQWELYLSTDYNGEKLEFRKRVIIRE